MEQVSNARTRATPKPPVQATTLGDFRSIASDSFVPLSITAAGPGPFMGRLNSTDADDVIFTEVEAKPHLVERTSENIECGGSGFYKVSLLLSGSSILVQDGREVVMQPGELTVYDTSRPYSLLFGEDIRNLIMMFPKSRLDLPIPFTEQLTAVSLSKEHNGLAPIVSSFLSQFPAQLEPLPDRVRAKLAHTSLDLIATLFSSILDSDAANRDPHQMLLQRVYAYIDNNLGSPDLSPGTIAQAHFVSTRHLHALFRQADTTISTWIRERRLESCRKDLLDPVLSDRSVAAISARWGFTDAAHFSRIFKAAYGVSPSQLRHG